MTLTGSIVTLEPLSQQHHDALVEATSDGEMWKLWYTSIPSPEGMRAEIDRRLSLLAKGDMVPLVTRRNDTGQVVGMTTYMNIDAKNRRVEIGSTWNRASAQRSGTNTESKLLMLTQAFEVWNCIAVEFRTHFFNQQSRTAIARLGAKQDGILRNHQQLADGSFRDTVVFSIIPSEWPAVRNNLLHMLSRS